MKSYVQWIPLGLAISLAAGIGVSYSANAVQLFNIHWLFLVSALYVAWGPAGKIKLTTAEAKAPQRWWIWAGQLIGLQLCCGAVFFGISVCCGQSAPVQTEAQPHLFSDTLRQLLVSEGLFPWGLVALIAAGIGYNSYYRRQDAYLALLLYPLISANLGQVVINFIGRLATMLAYAGTFSLLALLWVSAMSWVPLATGFNLAALGMSVILLLISTTAFYRRQVSKIFGSHIPLPVNLFLWVVSLATSIWLLNGLLSPLAQHPVSPPTILGHWQTTPWRRLWLVFANSWWLLWTPILGMTIARVSRGYSLRETILMSLALPLALSLSLGLPHLHWQISAIHASFIAGAGLVGLLWLTTHKKAVPTFVLTYLPRQGHDKFRPYQSTFIKVTQTAAGFLFLYLPGGMVIIHILGIAAAIPLLLCGIAGVAAGLFRSLSRSHQ